MEQHSIPATALQRFFPKFSISTELFHNGTPCWTWTASTKKTGYGSFGWSRRSQSIHAHMAAYLLLVGPVPEGLELDHLCRRRNCVNPDHLEPVTCGENVRRGDAPKIAGTWQRERTHCPSGHEYTPGNTYSIPGRGPNRHCRQCRQDREKARCVGGHKVKTHCVNGHEFTPENTYLNKGWRSCLQCRRDAMARVYARRKS